MGQARQRKLMAKKIESLDRQWLLSLSSKERAIVDVACRIHQRIVLEGGMWGGCYHLSFFLKRYLKRERNIDVDVVVGWVSEDSWTGVASHCWVEFEGRKIDMALSCTENPQVLPTGGFILLDRVLLQGMADYRYHREVPEQAEETLIQLALAPETAEESRQAHRQHRQMAAIAADDQAMDTYLSERTGGRDYRTLALLAVLPLA